MLPEGKIIKELPKNGADRPFTEGKEIIGRYVIVIVNGYDEAVALCEGYPDYEIGGNSIMQAQKIEMPA